MSNRLSLNELLKTRAPLDAELAPFLKSHSALGQVLQHPLVYFVPYFEQMAAYANAMLMKKKAALETAIEKKVWDRVVGLHERPWRCDAFDKHADQMDDQTYWSLLAWIYTDSENIHENFEAWERLLCTDRPGRDAFMSADEALFMAALPERIRVFRGGTDRSVTDFSWSVDERVAAWFAQRAVSLEGRSGPGVVLEGWVDKADVIGYKNNRDEAEIIVSPSHVDIVHAHRERFAPTRPRRR